MESMGSDGSGRARVRGIGWVGLLGQLRYVIPGYYLVGGCVQPGVAANWGRVNEDSFGQGLGDPIIFGVFDPPEAMEPFTLMSDTQCGSTLLKTRQKTVWISGWRTIGTEGV